MIDFTHVNSAQIFKNELKEKMYGNVNKAAKKTAWTRLSGLGIGIASGALEVTFSVGYLGETIIKAFGNIFGHFISPRCDAMRGLKQLVKEVPFAAFILAATPIYAVAGVIIATVGMLFSPEKYTESQQAMHHEQVEKLKK